MKILVVDDSELMRMAVRKELEDLGFEIVEADSGKDAIRKLILNSDVRLVTLDVDMPGMNGFDTLHRIRNDYISDSFNSRVPVVFVTSHDSLQDRVKGFQLGAADFVHKSYISGQLNAIIRRILWPDNEFKGAVALVVDDSPTALEIMRKLLESKGVNALCASNGLEAVRILKEDRERIDIVISDLVMEKMDGEQLVRFIRKDLGMKAVPVILLSSVPDRKRLIELFSSGITDYLNKPFLKEEFFARVKVHLQMSKDRKIIERNRHELKMANATKDKFFSIISHDLRGPIGNFATLIDLIQDPDDLLEEEEKAQLMDELKQSAKTTFALLENLLEWSRTQRGTIKFNPVDSSLNDIASSNYQLLKPAAQNKKIQLKLEMEPNLVACVDHHMVNTVIRNLLNNAVKFTPEGGTITLAGKTIENSVELRVSDTGVGITPENQEKLFRLDQHYTTRGTNAEKGSGLGLILCKEFVERNGGTITLESEPGKGASFIIHFPAGKGVPAAGEDIVQEIPEGQSIPHQETSDNRQQAIIEEAIDDCEHLSMEARMKLPELLGLLEENFKPRWEEVNEYFVLHKIQDFVSEIISLGKGYDVPPLMHWAESIQKHLKRFDMVRSQKELETFPELLSRMREYMARDAR